MEIINQQSTDIPAVPGCQMVHFLSNLNHRICGCEFVKWNKMDQKFPVKYSGCIFKQN